MLNRLFTCFTILNSLALLWHHYSNIVHTLHKYLCNTFCWKRRYTLCNMSYKLLISNDQPGWIWDFIRNQIIIIYPASIQLLCYHNRFTDSDIQLLKYSYKNPMTVLHEPLSLSRVNSGDYQFSIMDNHEYNNLTVSVLRNTSEKMLKTTLWKEQMIQVPHNLADYCWPCWSSVGSLLDGGEGGGHSPVAEAEGEQKKKK